MSAGSAREAGLGVAAARPGPLVERVQQAPHLEVREREHVAQAAGKQRTAVTYSRPAARQLDPHRGQRVEIERRPLGSPDELGRGQPPGPREIVHLVVPLVPHARRVHPPQHIASAVRARQPRVLPHREGHRPTRPLQLGGQLHAGRRRTHDEHAAVGELGGVTVVERRQLLDGRRHRAGELRHRRLIAGTARDDHGLAAKLAAARRHAIAVVGAPHRRDGRARPDGST